MKTNERKRIANELCADFKRALLKECAKMPDDWNGLHVRAMAGMIMNTINKRGNEVTFGLSDGNIIRCILNPDGQSIRVETVHIGTRPQAKRDSLLGHYTITVQTCD